MEAAVVFEEFLQKAIGRKKINEFEEKLWINNSRLKNIRTFLEVCSIQGTILMLAGMLFLYFYLLISPEKVIIIGICFFFLPFAINYIFQDLIFEKIKREKEALLCDLLLQASIFCDESSLQRTIERIVESDFGALSRDFRRALTEIKKGASIEESLNHIKEANRSTYYSRVIDLFIQGYQSGSSMSDTLKETAEDILQAQAIIKERQAVMLVTKYTLIFSSALIVPGILGLMIGLIGGLNLNSMGEIGFGLSLEERSNLFNFSSLGAGIYVLEYALLSAYFISVQESNIKQFFIYAPILALAGSAVFFIAQIL